MDDKAEILQAINQLGTAMSRELAELKAGQAKLEAGQAKLEAKVDRIEAGQVRLEAGQAKLEAGQIATNERLARVEGRIEEQSHILAVLIPTKIAAVGGR